MGQIYQTQNDLKISKFPSRNNPKMPSSSTLKKRTASRLSILLLMTMVLRTCSLLAWFCLVEEKIFIRNTEEAEFSVQKCMCDDLV